MYKFAWCYNLLYSILLPVYSGVYGSSVVSLFDRGVIKKAF